jgi:hypothetical protein
MTRSTIIRTSVVAFAAAATFAQAALASGEPKNEWPFTRPVAQRTQQAAQHTAAQADPVIQGEPKNEPPFTRPATVVVVSGGGFSWTDGAIGGVAGLGVAIAGTGALLVARRSPRTA